MPRIRLSESELTELAGKVQKQKRNIDAVTRAGVTAVNQADADWRSSAFETFKGRWTRDRNVLDKLATELSDWNRKLGQHARVANVVNKPFR
jgi:uncharacterized protein YukE